MQLFDYIKTEINRVLYIYSPIYSQLHSTSCKGLLFSGDRNTLYPGHCYISPKGSV